MREFEYGRGVMGNSFKSISRMAQVLETDLRSMNDRWGIDGMTCPEWKIEEDVTVRFRYDSKGWRDFCERGIE